NPPSAEKRLADNPHRESRRESATPPKLNSPIETQPMANNPIATFPIAIIPFATPNGSVLMCMIGRPATVIFEINS
ncbi:hypothetical protein, partial [Mesotoga sp.]|uniref:hypothetical protein n=1 Tax=Mesotoga sp. TaxID=2053577 RepID=UPI00345EA0A6